MKGGTGSLVGLHAGGGRCRGSDPSVMKISIFCFFPLVLVSVKVNRKTERNREMENGKRGGWKSDT